MKYMISWFERPQGSPAEYENAQKRILDVFGQWKAPANFKIEVLSCAWVSGVGTCWWTATIRWRFTRFARRSLHLNSRRARWLPSRTQSGSNSKPSPGAMD